MNAKSIAKKIKHLIIPSKIVNIIVTTSAPNELLNEEVVIVTGGTSGIGKSIAEHAVAQSARVIIVGRREDRLKEVCTSIGEQNCKYMVCDITAVSDYIDFFQEAEKLFDKSITGVVNNAGIYINKSMLDFSNEDYQKTMDINLKAPMFLIREYVRYCLDNKIRGNLVVTASNRGLFGDYGPYGVSKRGIISFVEGLARELVGTGIRVNAVAPGMTASEINNIDVKGNMYTSSARGERVLLPDEIAEVVCFLLSNNSKCITGAVIPCDEGDSLR